MPLPVRSLRYKSIGASRGVGEGVAPADKYVNVSYLMAAATVFLGMRQ